MGIYIFRTGDYVFTLDLKSGYHHVDIYQQHWKYLGFAWGVGSNLNYHVFGVLPFGLATACYLFTKFVKATCETLETARTTSGYLSRRWYCSCQR